MQKTLVVMLTPAEKSEFILSGVGTTREAACFIQMLGTGITRKREKLHPRAFI